MTYQAWHKRLRKLRGAATDHLCAFCTAWAHDWAFLGISGSYSTHETDYVPLCRTCHVQKDDNKRKEREKTHCKHGHLRSEHSTMYTGTKANDVRRYCVTCARDRARIYSYTVKKSKELDHATRLLSR